MKNKLLLLLAIYQLSTITYQLRAQGLIVSNINIGVDLNSYAWAKVNNNNNVFVSWIDALSTNVGVLGAGLSVVQTNSIFSNALIRTSSFIGGIVSNTIATNSTFSGTIAKATILGTVQNGFFTNSTTTNSLFAGTNLSPFQVHAPGQWLTVRPGSSDADGNPPTVEFTTVATGSDRGGLQFEGYSDSGAPIPLYFVGHGTDVNDIGVRFAGDGKVRYDAPDGLELGPYDLTVAVPGLGGGAFAVRASTTGYVGINQPSPAYRLDITGDFGDSADGTYYMDNGGNLTCTTLTQTSDRALKEKIKPIASGAALAQILLLTNYEWNFKSRTNFISRVSATTNSVTISNQLVKTVVLTTNQVPKIIPAGEKQIGPMAQDWHAATGLGDGRHISAIAFNGLLLGGIQDLAARETTDEQYPRIPVYTPPSSSSTTFGYGAGLVACDETNIYISTGTNSWRRLALQGW